MQLDMEARSGRHGIAHGTSWHQRLVDAEESLFKIDEALRELWIVCSSRFT